MEVPGWMNESIKGPTTSLPGRPPRNREASVEPQARLYGDTPIRIEDVEGKRAQVRLYEKPYERENRYPPGQGEKPLVVPAQEADSVSDADRIRGIEARRDGAPTPPRSHGTLNAPARILRSTHDPAQ